MKNNNIYFFLISLLSFLSLQAQENDSSFVIGSFKAQVGVRLKWVPGTLNQIDLGQKFGYNIFRANVIRANGKQTTGDYKKLNDSPIIPWTQEKFQAMFVQDSMFGFIGQYLKFPEALRKESAPKNLKEAVKHQDSYEFINFFATLAIFEKNVYAESLGYFYVDKTASSTGEYLYRVELVGNEKYVNYALVDCSREGYKTPIPQFDLELKDETIKLTWFNNEGRDYVGYNFYRSEKKNGPFEKLNDRIYLSSNTAILNGFAFYEDSIRDYGKTFYYKIRGVNPFEEEGPETSVKEIRAFKMLSQGIVLNEGEDYGKLGVRLSWQMDPEDLKSTKEINLFHAITPDGPFVKINSAPISPKLKDYFDRRSKITSNYYYASAKGFGGDSVRSIIKAVILIDSIAPEVPEFIKITCDTNGIVTAKWKQNKDKDLQGYRLFRTFDRSTEPERMNRNLITDTTFTDTINLKEGYNKVFYRLHACDMMFNPSNPTAYYPVTLPDKIKPNPGYFTEYNITFKGIDLQWQKPADQDLKKLTLYRKAESDFGFYPHLVLRGDSLNVMHLLDTVVTANLSYTYFLQAEDESGLLSEKSQPLRLTMLDNRILPKVENLQSLVSKEHSTIKLTWQIKANVNGYQLFRAEKGGKLNQYDYIKGNVREYYDKFITPNTEYTYMLIADLPTGYTSGPSNKLKVNY